MDSTVPLGGTHTACAASRQGAFTLGKGTVWSCRNGAWLEPQTELHIIAGSSSYTATHATLACLQCMPGIEPKQP